MPTPREVRTLVQRFSENRASYVSGPYNETQIESADPRMPCIMFVIRPPRIQVRDCACIGGDLESEVSTGSPLRLAGSVGLERRRCAEGYVLAQGD